jgi:predicted enzyme related to lactoylglutathione lyase
MGERTSYKPGTFCWADLGTTDVDSAKSFYTGLFGWSAEDAPAGEAGTYTVFRLDGKDVCGLYEQPEGQRSQGVPPNWQSYVSVEEADAAAERAKSLGGAVLAEPFDVMDRGRMAVVQDPTGAVFSLWEPRGNFGASLVNDPGTVCWNQLNTTDVDVAKEFYAALFGWEGETIEAGGTTYVTLTNDGWRNGGIMHLPEEVQAPPHWSVYFAVDSVDGSSARAAELGGRVFVPPMDVPAGRMSVVQDPQAASLGLFEGDTDP